MKKSAFFWVLLAFASLVVNSCTTSSGGQQASNWHVGSQGVEATFVINTPSKVYTGDTLDLAIEVKNKGAYPNPEEQRGAFFDGKIYVYGYDQSNLDPFTPRQLPTDFYGKDQFNREGGITTVNFHTENVNLPVGKDSFDVPLTVAVCYRYQTIASPTVCIDPDPYSTKVAKKACTADRVIMGSSTQGGPVAVSSVAVETGSNQIRFKIDVSNVGGGDIVEYNNLNNCPFNLRANTQVTDIVYVSGEIANSNIYCTNNGQLRMYNGRGTMYCFMSKPADQSARPVPLNIRLDYAYVKYSTKNLKIVNTR